MILPGFFDACEACGEPFERNTTYPVLTTEDGEGTMEVHSFCNQACLSTWRERNSREAFGESDGGAEA